MEIFNWVSDNYGLLSTCVLAALGLAAAVAKLTPNKKDDRIVGLIQNAVAWLFSMRQPSGQKAVSAKREPLFRKR